MKHDRPRRTTRQTRDSDRSRRVARKLEDESRRLAAQQAALRDAQARGVAVDRGALSPDGSYGVPAFVERGYYVDIPFECRDCGADQIWTASQQKWWYEVAKGGVWTTATRCRACRRRERAQRVLRGRQGDPNRYRSPGLLLARLRSELEPGLGAAGFEPAGRNPRHARRHRFLQYARPGELFSLTWDQYRARLTAELIVEGEAGHREIAAVELSNVRSACDVEAALEPFLTLIRAFLHDLPASLSHPEDL